MSAEAQNYLMCRFREVIDYARKEFDLTYADVLGTLEFVKAEVSVEAAELSLDDTETEPGG